MPIHLQATIFKPAVMIGTEDRILNPWAQFAKKYGFIPLIGDGSTKYVAMQYLSSLLPTILQASNVMFLNAFAESNLFMLLMLHLQLLHH